MPGRNARRPTAAGWFAQRRLAGAVDLGGWWQGQPALPLALDSLKGRRIVAAAGLAQPERFFGILRAAGIDIEPLALADHFDYATRPWPAGTSTVIVTEKDAVKLDPRRVGEVQVWVAALDFSPAPAFGTQVLRLLGHPVPSVTPPAHGNPIA